MVNDNVEAEGLVRFNTPLKPLIAGVIVVTPIASVLVLAGIVTGSVMMPVPEYTVVELLKW